MRAWKSGGLAEVWKYYTPPARPSASEIEIIRNELEKKRVAESCKVLIMGVTAEYRLLCRKLGIGPTLVDFNEGNYDILSEEIGKRDERFVLSDWRDMRFVEEFDAVLGDNALNMVGREDCEKLLAKVHCSLRKGGMFLPRLYTRTKEGRISREEIVGLCERLKGRPGRFFMYAIRDLLLAYYNFDEDFVYTHDIWDGIEGIVKTRRHLGGLLEALARMGYDLPGHRLHVPEERKFEETAGKFFRIEGKECGNEDYLKCERPLRVSIYVLRKQS
ncbi:MAG: class I SAM-dependent methyltransferase [Candidatus Micrarchaeota archaeon]